MIHWPISSRHCKDGKHKVASQELKIQSEGRCQVVKLIKEINSSHAFGYDRTHTSSMNIVAKAIAASIADIIIKSIDQKKVPQ